MSVEQVREWHAERGEWVPVPGRWRVRWREGRRARSRVVGRKRDAEAVDADIRRRQRLGTLAVLDAGDQTLEEFGKQWWARHAEPNLARSTLELYAMLLDVHVMPRLGGYQLRELTVDVLQRFRVELEGAGVGRVSVQKALTLLHGILERACELGRLESNPARHVRKPSASRERLVEPLAPALVERLRLHLLEHRRLRDATLVSLLAYAGLRPGEALGLTWRRVQDSLLVVDVAVSLGEVGGTKTRKPRTVTLLSPLAHDLAEWRIRTGRPGGEELVFSARDGGPWSKELWANWRRRVYAPAARAVGIENPRPYDLRHSFVSLLIHEGRSIVEVATEAGHSPQVALGTYGHVFRNLDGERVPAEDAIRAARSGYSWGQLALAEGGRP